MLKFYFTAAYSPPQLQTPEQRAIRSCFPGGGGKKTGAILGVWVVKIWQRKSRRMAYSAARRT